MVIISVCPGRKRTGICVEDSVQGTLRRGVISSLSLSDHISKYKSMYPDSVVVCEDTERARDLISSFDFLNTEIVYIYDKKTKSIARQLYWRRHRKPWWAFFLPKAILKPKRRIDDYKATVLARKYIKDMENS